MTENIVQLVLARTPDAPEGTYPLHARVCERCWLVQVDDVVPEDAIFNSDYAYFSSFSESWLAHCKAYAEKMTAELGLDPSTTPQIDVWVVL